MKRSAGVRDDRLWREEGGVGGCLVGPGGCMGSGGVLRTSHRRRTLRVRQYRYTVHTLWAAGESMMPLSWRYVHHRGRLLLSWWACSKDGETIRK